MPARYTRAAPYAKDALNLPVRSVPDALPFYEGVMGFRIVSRSETPHARAVLARDAVQIGLAENGGEPEQEGCFFEVDNVEEAAAELKARGLEKISDFRTDKHGEASFRVFFVIAPDGLCYCIGERQSG